MSKVFCDLCDKEVKKAEKQDEIWVCIDCDKKYPRIKGSFI